MHPPGADTVLVRHGELNTKSTPVKREMVGQLCTNLEALLADRSVPGEVERHWTRPLVHTEPESVARATAITAETFGVVSASAAIAVDTDFESIVDALAEIAIACYTEGAFAVDAHRADKSLPFTTVDIEREGGTAIWEAVEDRFEPEVDLENPDITFGVDIRNDTTYCYLETIDGPGGLPLGTQAPVVALISGGIDSPVAAYEMMRRGSPIIPVYVDLGPFGGADHEARAIETVRTLASYAPNFGMELYQVPGGETLTHLEATMETGRMLSVRRFLYRVSEEIAKTTGAVGIVTGEAVGQKSSQTARNFAVTSPATRLPVHRPLLTVDKQEIVSRARELGTFADSTIPTGCNRIVPDQTETNARLEVLLQVEPDDLFERAAAAAREATVLELA